MGRDKEFDIFLAEYDVQGSIAHVTMLGEVGLMTKEEADTAIKGLDEILATISTTHISRLTIREDIHSQVEFLLTQKIGDAGKKIHSGRSRNDQVAVDIKLYLRAEILNIKDEAKVISLNC